MRWKHFFFRLMGKDPEAVVVSFCSGPADLALRMVSEVRGLVPEREHFAVSDVPIPNVQCIRPSELPGPLRGKRIGLAPVLFSGAREYSHIRRLAFRMAPTKLLAFNRALERHHLRLRSIVASVLFMRGVALDRIWLRPKWFPFRKEHSRWPETHIVCEGRSMEAGRRRVAVLSPYFPFPLSHGGAVRIFNLIREASRDFDVFLFAFAEKPTAADSTPVMDYCAKAIVFPNPRYREPRWASINPPEVNEFSCAYVTQIIEQFRKVHDIRLLQVEYTQMASYSGDVLVEHDVMLDLYGQIYSRGHSFTAWWDLWRWRRYERAALLRFRRVAVMSTKDAELTGVGQRTVIPNGVDLHRFRPEPESEGERLLFVGSFAHFPNVAACRWFVGEVLPLLRQRRPEIRFTIIAGRNPELYESDLPRREDIEFYSFISDVRPFYTGSNVVVVPTQVSAGTNLKVLEAMAMERAVVSTTSGCAGLGLRHGLSLWIADDPAEFALAVDDLLSNRDTRRRIAEEGRRSVESRYGWERIGALQRRMWIELLATNGISVRRGTKDDLLAMEAIQAESHGASHWEPETYFMFDVQVAERNDAVCGFMVCRMVAPDEAEILNLAVASASRRLGIATALLESIFEAEVFLEVRESNEVARSLYWKLGFRVVGRREDYYDDPAEAALVMRRSRKLHSP